MILSLLGKADFQDRIYEFFTYEHTVEQALETC